MRAKPQDIDLVIYHDPLPRWLRSTSGCVGMALVYSVDGVAGIVDYSLRSDGRVNVAKIARHFGGGGSLDSSEVSYAFGALANCGALTRLVRVDSPRNLLTAQVWGAMLTSEPRTMG